LGLSVHSPGGRFAREAPFTESGRRLGPDTAGPCRKENVEVLRRADEAFNRGDFEGFLSLQRGADALDDFLGEIEA